MVGLGVGVGAGVGLGTDDGVGVGVSVGVGLGPGAGTAGAAPFCGDGAPCTKKSSALSFVSMPLPALAPGRRSRLEPADGAVVGVPSTKGFSASPHPTASIGVPPTARSTIAPPVAASPPL